MIQLYKEKIEQLTDMLDNEDITLQDINVMNELQVEIYGIEDFSWLNELVEFNNTYVPKESFLKEVESMINSLEMSLQPLIEQRFDDIYDGYREIKYGLFEDDDLTLNHELTMESLLSERYGWLNIDEDEVEDFEEYIAEKYSEY